MLQIIGMAQPPFPRAKARKHIVKILDPFLTMESLKYQTDDGMPAWVLWTDTDSFGIIVEFDRWYGLEDGKLAVPRFSIGFRHGTANNLYELPSNDHYRRFFPYFESDDYHFKRHFWSPIARLWAIGDYDSVSVTSELEIDSIIEQHLPNIIKAFQKFVLKRGGPDINYRGEWPLENPENTAVFTSTRIMNGQQQIVRLIYDEDGDWQALDKLPRKDSESVVIGVDHIVEMQPNTVEGLKLLEKHGTGHQVIKDSKDKWQIQPYKEQS